ncbi:MAG: SH3 domain-containing protein [Ruminococcus sp.]|nr:SH3 domain-containing protein [Ruminococcus sp.]
MKKNLLLVIMLSVITLSGCGTDDTSNAEITPSDTVIETTTIDTQNISTGYIVTNGQDYIELYNDTTGTNVISRMYDNESVTVYFIDGEWANISYGGMVGYVSLQNLSFTKHEVEVTTTTTTEVKIEEVKESDSSSSKDDDYNQNIEQNINIVFLNDNDGFEVAQPTSYSTYSSTNKEAWCSAESIYIYSQPTTNSSKREADMLYYGDSLTILGTVDDWYYISTDSGNGYDLHGYVKQGYITIGVTPVAEEPENASYGRVSVKSANVRSSPNKETNDNVLFTVYQGAEFTVLDYDGYWYKINYNGTICYISHKMVEVW